MGSGRIGWTATAACATLGRVYGRGGRARRMGGLENDTGAEPTAGRSHRLRAKRTANGIMDRRDHPGRTHRLRAKGTAKEMKHQPSGNRRLQSTRRLRTKGKSSCWLMLRAGGIGAMANGFRQGVHTSIPGRLTRGTRSTGRIGIGSDGARIAQSSPANGMFLEDTKVQHKSTSFLVSSVGQSNNSANSQLLNTILISITQAILSH